MCFTSGNQASTRAEGLRMRSAHVAIRQRPESVFAKRGPKRNVLLPAYWAIPSAQVLEVFLNYDAMSSDLQTPRKP